MSRDAYNNVTINSRCSDTKLTILNTSKMLFNLLNTTKTGNIRVVFERVSELCNKTTYDKLLSNFELSSHEYVGRVSDIKSAPGSFILNILIDNVSIKISVEGIKDLFIYKASVKNSEIYFDDINYKNNVMRNNVMRRNNDYIWITKNSLTEYKDDIMFMLDSVMFACHFPIIIDKKPIIPSYTIKSINVNGRDIQVTPLLKVNNGTNRISNTNTNVNSDINALKGMLPDIKWPSNVEINNTKKGVIKFDSFAGVRQWNSLNRQLPNSRFPQQKVNSNANPLNSLNRQLPNSRFPQQKVNSNANPFNSLNRQLPNSRFPKANSLSKILPTPRWPQIMNEKNTEININNSQVERWAKKKGMPNLDKFKRRENGNSPMNNSEFKEKLPTPRWSRIRT